MYLGDEGTTIRILNLSTSGIACGIADYNDHVVDAIRRAGAHVETVPIDLDQVASGDGLEPLRPFVEKLDRFDAVLIQHEHGLFGKSYSASLRRFRLLSRRIRQASLPAVVVFHTRLRHHRLVHCLQTRSGLREWVQERLLVREINRNGRLLGLVHGSAAQSSMEDIGLQSEKVEHVLHPVPSLETGPTAAAPRSDDTITLAIFGFVSQYKGYEAALRAVGALGRRYRLIIAGGRHPRDDTDQTLDTILGCLRTGRWQRASTLGLGTEHIVGEGLHDRVTITGHLSPQRAVEILSGTDIVLAPYQPNGPDGSGALNWSLALARPIIASRTQTFREIAKASGALELVTANAPFELADAIARLADSPERRSQLSLSARRFAASHGYPQFARLVLDRLSGLRAGNRIGAAANQIPSIEQGPGPTGR